MSLRRSVAAFLAVISLEFLVACGGNYGTRAPAPVPPPSGGFTNSNLNGTYVFSASGTDQSGYPYAIVGSFTANGNGGISGGTVDLSDASLGSITKQQIQSSSTYSVYADGRGTITMNAPGVSRTSLTIGIVLQNKFHGLVSELDTLGSGSGTIDLQTAGATPTGSYAFLLSGAAAGSTATTVAVGGFTVGSGGSATGVEDINSGGIVTSDTAISGTVVAAASGASTLASVGYDVYVADSNHLKFIETDGKGVLSGDAYSQTSATFPTGTMSFTLIGTNTGNAAAVGGYMTANSSGTITNGTEDANFNGQVPATPIPFTATYAAGGTGRFTITFAPSTFVGGSTFAAYPSTGGLLLLQLDQSVGTSLAGAAYSQVSSAAISASQGYAMNFSGTNLAGASSFSGSSGPVEVDDLAEFTVASSGALTGLIDENYAPGGSGAVPVGISGNVTGPDSTGRYGISATNAANGAGSTLNGGFTVTVYTADGNNFPFIEVDPGQVSAGVLILQNAAATSPTQVRPSLFVMHQFVPSRMLRQRAK